MRTKSQRYSDIVFGNIRELTTTNDDLKAVRKYKSLCKRAGGVLRTVGLIQFCTFLAAKATKPTEIHHGYLLEHLKSELEQITDIHPADFLSQIQRQELPEYMHTTLEVLKLLQWHKRISEILIAGKAEED